MGTVHGICPWVIVLVMGKFDGGGVLGELWMVFLWDPCLPRVDKGPTGSGKRKHQVKYSRVVFRWTTRVFKQTHFLMLYIMY